ncbi:MAG: phosphatidylinositol-specific phospholipase C1-like protein [Pseudomonadota bacterium]
MLKFEPKVGGAFAALVALALAGCVEADAPCPNVSTDLEGECIAAVDDLTVADLQAVGSHNSYKIAIPAAELALIAATSPEAARSLDYGHIPLQEQLDLGMRQLELDVFYDPEGGRYADPALARLTSGQDGSAPYDASQMLAPGFKVKHTQDIDPRSHCPTFVGCLEEIEAWSRANPDHIPLLIMVNLKTGSLGIPGTVDALDFDAAAFDALDEEILGVFEPEHLITPDEVRGASATLREAVLERGWPALKAARGRLIFVLDTGSENVTTYLRGTSSLEGLPIFVNSLSEDHDHAAYFTMNNPIRDGEMIASRVAQGFLVRTRSDAGTEEARTGDITRREAAFASGAHYISTDYYAPRTEWSDFAVTLPGSSAARCNPVRRDNTCRSRPGGETAE